VVDTDLVILGSASKPVRRLVNTIGQRVPLRPPIGLPLIAWSSVSEINRWLTVAKEAQPEVDSGMVHRPRQRSTDGTGSSRRPVSRRAHRGHRTELLNALQQVATSDGHEPTEPTVIRYHYQA
jgi:hypothetical protein